MRALPGVKPCARSAKPLPGHCGRRRQAAISALPWKIACVMRGAVRAMRRPRYASARRCGTRPNARNVPPGASRTSSSARMNVPFRRRCSLLRPGAALILRRIRPRQHSVPTTWCKSRRMHAKPRRNAVRQCSNRPPRRARHTERMQAAAARKARLQQRQAEDAAKGKKPAAPLPP